MNEKCEDQSLLFDFFLKGKVKVKVDPGTAEVGNLHKRMQIALVKKKRPILHGQFDGWPVGGEETYS